MCACLRFVAVAACTGTCQYICNFLLALRRVVGGGNGYRCFVGKGTCRQWRGFGMQCVQALFALIVALACLLGMCRGPVEACRAHFNAVDRTRGDTEVAART